LIGSDDGTDFVIADFLLDISIEVSITSELDKVDTEFTEIGICGIEGLI